MKIAKLCLFLWQKCSITFISTRNSVRYESLRRMAPSNDIEGFWVEKSKMRQYKHTESEEKTERVVSSHWISNWYKNSDLFSHCKCLQLLFVHTITDRYMWIRICKELKSKQSFHSPPFLSTLHSIKGRETYWNIKLIDRRLTRELYSTRSKWNVLLPLKLNYSKQHQQRYSWERKKKRRKKMFIHIIDRATEGCDKASLHQVGHYFEFFFSDIFPRDTKETNKTKTIQFRYRRKMENIVFLPPVKPKNDLLLNSFW